MLVNDLITSPLIDFFANQNYSAEVINGKKLIKKFDSTDQELNSLYKGVGLRDISHEGILELRGKDVLDFLHRIATNSTKDLPKAELTRTIFTNEKGRVIDVASLFNFEDYQLLICSAENKLKVKSWIEKYTITDDVITANVTGKYVVLEVIGPQSVSFLMLLCGSMINSLNENTFKVVHAEGLLFFLAKMKMLNGQTKFLIIADPENGKNIVKFMQENKGPFDFNLVGEDAYNTYRIEQGIPGVPFELNDTVNPHEVKITEYIDFKKGCYIGQEVIARLETYEKVQRYLMGVKFSSKPDDTEEILLVDEEGKDAGKVTSITNSERLKNYIGLAFVRKFYAEEGKTLFAKSGSQQLISVQVSNLPFKK